MEIHRYHNTNQGRLIMKNFKRVIGVFLMFILVSGLLTACSSYSGGQTYYATNGSGAKIVLTTQDQLTGTVELTHVLLTMNGDTKEFNGTSEFKISGDHILFKPEGVYFYYCGTYTTSCNNYITSITAAGVTYKQGCYCYR